MVDIEYIFKIVLTCVIIYAVGSVILAIANFFNFLNGIGDTFSSLPYLRTTIWIFIIIFGVWFFFIKKWLSEIEYGKRGFL